LKWALATVVAIWLELPEATTPASWPWLGPPSAKGTSIQSEVQLLDLPINDFASLKDIGRPSSSVTAE
jgi:hypothetical protein